jgi:hypothetical protein
LLAFFCFFVFGSQTACAQNSVPYFYFYNNCQFLDENKAVGDVLEEVKEKDKSKIFNDATIQIPSEIANKELRPRINSDLYIFDNSTFVGSAKVKKIYARTDGAGSPFVLVYDIDDRGLPADLKNIRKKEGLLEISCIGPVNVKELKKINARNEQLLIKNRLTDKEIVELDSKISEVMNSKSQTTNPSLAPKLVSKSSQKLKTKFILESWIPTLDSDWMDHATVQSSLKLVKPNTKIVLFKIQENSSFLFFMACQTINGISFNQINAEGDASIAQIVNWFGNYYISVLEMNSGGYSQVVYKITDKGLTNDKLNEAGEGGLDID